MSKRILLLLLVGLLLLAVSGALLLIPQLIDKAQLTEDQSAWANFLGSLHPLLLHLPIGFLLLIVCMEGHGLVSKKANYNLTLPLVLNALAALAAASFGYLLYLTGGWSGELIETHLWQGSLFAVSALWLPLLYLLFQKKAKILYYLGLLGSVGILVSAAHHGGELTHGDPLAKAPWNQQAPTEKVAFSMQMGLYEDVVHPILAAKCISCHGENKQKNGLRLDSLEHILEGGKNGPALVAGDPASSTLITSIEHMPIEDDEHMPPKNKPQITQDELTLLKYWVQINAPEKKTLEELKPTEELLALIAAQSDPALAEKPAPQPTEDQEASRTKEQIAQFNAVLEKFPNALFWTSQKENTMRFSAASLRESFTDEDLSLLEGIAPDLRALDLNSTKVSDQSAQFFQQAENLQILQLAETSVTDAIIDTILKLPALETLVLHSTSITDEGAEKLKEASQLKKLYLWNTQVSPVTAKNLRKALPECFIYEGSAKKHIPQSPEDRSPLRSGLSMVVSSTAQWDEPEHHPRFLDPNYREKGFTFHTSKEKNPSVIIDLSQEYSLDELIVRNRDDLRWRAQNLSCQVSIDGEHWETVHQADGKVRDFWRFTQVGKNARYIKLFLDQEEPQFFHLKNIEIYVKN